MVYGLVIAVHVLVALFLIGVILLQGGRGSLGETMGGAAAQSLFGGGANIMMTKITAVCAGLFMVTCLSLALLSTHRGRSVIDQIPMRPEQLPGILPPAAPAQEPPAQEPPAPASAPEASPPPAEEFAAPDAPAETPAPSSPTADAPPQPVAHSSQ